MAKLTLSDLASLTNETSAITTINNNNAAIETALENTLSRDGTSPNSMGAQLDMNTHKIINLQAGSAAGEALEYSQLQDKVDDITTVYNDTVTLKNQAQAAQTAAELAQANAEAAESQSEDILVDVQALFDTYNNQFLGTFTADPTVDNDGNALTVGDIFYNSTTLSMRVWDGTNWQDIAAMTPTSTNTISNKTLTLGSNIITGTTAQFNTALTDDDFATLTNAVTLTNKTLTTPKIASILTNSGAATLTLPTSTDTLVGRDTTDTLTNKTLTSAKITTNLSPTTSDGAALGSTTLMFSDLFLATGAVINFNNGDVAITHSADSLSFTGGTYSFDNKISRDSTFYLDIISDKALVNFDTNDNFQYDRTNNQWYFIIGNTNKGILHANGFAPGSNDGGALGTASLGWSDLFLATGAVVNFNNGDYTLTHSTGVLTANKDLRVTTVGSDTTSVVTIGGSQTLTNKTLTSPTLTTPALGTPSSGTLNSCTTNTETQRNNSTQLASTAYADAQVDNSTIINTQTSSYTVVLADAGKTVEVNNASANTLTIPPNSSVAFPVGTYINCTQYGAGQTTLTAGSGVTIRSAGAALKLRSQYSTATLYKRATDEWVASGDLSA